MTKKLQLFAQLLKVDEAKREVSGIATAEVLDKDGEIFDYSSSVPYFKSWSDEISKATEGKSLGNIREMHEPSAVGKLTEIAFDDDLKQIQVVAKIVDEGAWQKCLQGVYTGFSIGGSYVKAWKDGEAVRFTAKPVEISVVDNPCVPTAHFTAVKLDGSSEIRKFAPRELKKDMYSVSSLASLLQSAVYLQMDATYEAEYEADDSKIPEDLKTWVKLGADILARMTEEELSELTARMKSAEDKMGKAQPIEKVGAKHSAETKAHHAAIAKCMGAIQKAAASAASHCDALMDKDMDSAATPVATKIVTALEGESSGANALAKKVPAEVEPKIEQTESTMNDTQVKTMEKAAADSASSLSKVAEVEKSVVAIEKTVTDLKAETATNNTELKETLAGILKFMEKMVPADATEQKVARTDLNPTVFKRDDTVIQKDQEAEKAKNPHEAMKAALQTPQDPRRYA